MAARNERTADGHVYARGEHRRFVHGHNKSGKRRPDLPGPNPSGLCMCGCGEKTPLATVTNHERGNIVGKPVRYVHGHNTRLSPVEYVEDENGCWIWQRAISQKGYGTATDRRRSAPQSPAHRVVYEREVGPVPDGYHVHHLCGVKRCVNPQHLLPMSADEHMALHREECTHG